MFWLALHFSALPLEIFSRGGAAPEAIAVIEKQGNRSRVKVCNKAASDLGVRPGMQDSAARALAADLIVRSRDITAEQESLAGLAAWAGSFTPDVSLQPPDGLLIEIGSCLRLHCGFRNLITQMRNGLNEMGYTCSLACAPTPHAAWLMALARKEVAIRESGKLEKALGELPVSVLDQSRDTLTSLEMVGAHTLGDCMQFPRAGMARRFGQSLLDELDRALGRLPEAREFFVPPPGFERRLELPTQVHEVEALLFAVRRLLLELEGYLSLRQAGVQELVLVCSHEDVPDTDLKIGFAQPTRDLNRMLLLARETLGRTRLPAPVHTILLKAGLIQAMELSNLDMFRDSAETTETADGNLLLERLRIRLGKEAVFSITACSRPPAGTCLATMRHQERKFHRQANFSGRCGCCPSHCPAGKTGLNWSPDRSGSKAAGGTAMDVVRDYYVAQGRNGSRLWVFRDRTSGAWFVHGLFA